VRESYRLVALKSMIAKLEESRPRRKK